MKHRRRPTAIGPFLISHKVVQPSTTRIEAQQLDDPITPPLYSLLINSLKVIADWQKSCH
jgi:hypothetical protein